MSDVREWKTKEARQWLLAKLYALYDQHGFAAGLEFRPSSSTVETEEPPFHLVDAICRQLQSAGYVKIFGQASDGSFCVRLTPEAYVMMRENREEEMEKELERRRKQIGFDMRGTS